MPQFDLSATYEPQGDQPSAIAELSEGLARGDRFQTLLGATGTGKTFSIAHVIAQYGRPTLVTSHNKTLAAQLYGEFKSLFPSNAVEYFISYYDYYQPEAYIPSTDTYIEKDATINEDIERLRLRATSSLMEREDVIVVASVSVFTGWETRWTTGHSCCTSVWARRSGAGRFSRRSWGFNIAATITSSSEARFRVRGDTVEIFPAYEEQAIRVELWGDDIERITRFEPLTGEAVTPMERASVYPASHYVTRREVIDQMVPRIRAEMKEQVAAFEAAGQLLEAQRIESRTNFDIEMMLEIGMCPGIENYSLYTSGRRPRGASSMPDRLLSGGFPARNR